MSNKNSIIKKDASIYVAGHSGMVGSAIVKCLRKYGYKNIINRNHQDLDLTQQQDVRDFFQSNTIDYVVVAAARVGGVYANSHYAAEFIYQNLMIEANVIHSAYLSGVNRLLFLGSSCIYPRLSKQPVKEEYLLTGTLEPTNEWYAIAKIAGIKLCQAYNRQYGTKYRCVMPSNLYGPGDNYDLMNSHVLPAFIRKFHLAKLAQQGNWDGIQKDESIYGKIPGDVKENLKTLSENKPSSSPETGFNLWGSGDPKREFLHVYDLAEAVLMVMTMSDDRFDSLCSEKNGIERIHENDVERPFKGVLHINVGAGFDMTIKDLAETVKNVVGYQGKVIWDQTKPDGIPRKLLDVSRISQTGWKPKIGLKQGISDTYKNYVKQN